MTIRRIPRLRSSVRRSLSRRRAIRAVNAGPVANIDDDMEAPILSRLMKKSHLTMAGENIPANTKYGKALDLKKSKEIEGNKITQKITVPAIVSISIAVRGFVLSIPLFTNTVANPIRTDDESANMSATMTCNLL
jgi:hypothetical protein